MNSPTQKTPSEEDSLARIEPGLKQTSVAATISFVFGVGAVATLALVRPSIILSVPAILFGHFAKSRLRSSNGELVGWGKARIGKLLGYFCLVVSTLLFFYLAEYRLLFRGALESERTAVVNAEGKFSPGRLGQIERKLAKGDATSFGNNELAGDMADKFRRELRESLNKVLTHRDDKGLGLDTTGISCYCQFSNPESKQICFIAAIPELSGYNGAAENVLKKAAWQSALLAVRLLSDVTDEESEDPASDLEVEAETKNGGEFAGEVAVGLMEGAKCEVVMLGKIDSTNESVSLPETVEDGGDRLADFIVE